MKLGHLGDERGPRVQQPFHDGGQRRLTRHQLANPDLKGLARDRANLQPEAPQDAAHAELDVDQLAQQGLAGRDDGPHLLRGQGLAVDRPIPSHAQELRNAARVAAVFFDGHRRQRRLHMPGLEQDDLKASLRQGGVEPLRQGPGLEPDAHDLDLQGGEGAHQSLRPRAHLRLADDLARPIHDANRRLFQGHVQTGIVLHGRPPSVILGAGAHRDPVLPSYRGTTTGQRSSSTPGPLPHLYGYKPVESLLTFLYEVLTTARGWTLIIVGDLIGFVLAAVVLAISVVSFPLLLDRDVGAAVAIQTSVRAVLANPWTTALWGLIVAGLLALSSAVLFVGLAVVVPVLGHATWHLYRRVVAG